MEWFGIAAVTAGLLAAAWAWARRSSPLVPRDRRIEAGRLRAFLENSEIDHSSTRHPNPDILRPHIAADDELLGAVEARHANKRALLVVLADRLVVGEATVGKMGAAVHTIPFHTIDEIEQGYDVGGTVHIVAGDRDFAFSHIPRSKTRDFDGLLRNRLGGLPET